MNQSKQISFIPDEEITLQKKAEGGAGNDLLNTSTYVDALVHCVNNAPDNKTFTIGLFGEWGSGKSSIVKTALERIEDEAKKKKEKVATIIYDSWKYSGDSFRRMFLYELRKKFEFEQTEDMKRFYSIENREHKIETKVNKSRLFAFIVFAFLSLLIFLLVWFLWDIKAAVPSGVALVSLFFSLYNWLFDNLKVSINKPLLFAPEQFEDCYHDMLSKAMKRHNWAQSILKWVTRGLYNKEISKLIIVIDNVDRCQPSVTYSLLSDIKTFLGDSQDVIFIVPVDVEAIRKHIINNTKETKGQTRDADEFLRKIFNVSIWIKAFQNDEMYDFTQNLNLKYSLGLNATSVSVISREYATNPRRIIQLLNNLIIEFTHFTPEFRKEHESIISLIAVIREEYPESYKMIVKNPKNLFSLIDNGKSECTPLLARTKAIVQKYENKLDILDSIISNSVVPDYLPFDVRQALLTSDIAAIKDYLLSKRSTKEDLRYRIMTCLWEGIRKAVERKTYLPDLYGYFCTMMGLNKSELLTQSDYLQLSNLINNDEAWSSLVSEVYLSQSSDLADFAVVLSENGYTSLAKAIQAQIYEWEIAEGKITDTQAAHIYNVCRKFSGKLVTNSLVASFRKLFAILPDKALEAKYQEPSRFFTHELLTDEISQIRLEDVGAEKNALSRFHDICKHIQMHNDELLSAYLKKMTEIMPDYYANRSNNPHIIQVCSTVNEMLETCKGVIFTESKPLQNFINKCMKTIQVSVGYNRVESRSVYKDEAENIDSLQELVRLFFNVQTHYPSMMLFDTQFVEFMLLNAHIGGSFCKTLSELISYRCTIEQYVNPLKQYPSVDESYRNILHYLYNDNTTGKPRVDDGWVVESIVKLVTAILNNNDTKVAEFLHNECTQSEHILKLLEDHLSKLSMQDFEKLLQTPLMAMTVDAFSSNIDSYQDNINVLTLIAEYGNKETINKLCQIIANKLTSGKYKEGVSLIGKLHLCDIKDINMLESIIETLGKSALSDDERASVLQRLKSLKIN